MLKAYSAVSVSHHIDFRSLDPRASSSDHTDSDLTINTHLSTLTFLHQISRPHGTGMKYQP